jgi:hypothetical protein
MLPPPASIAEGCEIRAIAGSGRGSGIGVGFFVMVMGEMVECLDCVAGVGVERNTIFCGAVKIFKGVQGSLVVTMRG